MLRNLASGCLLALGAAVALYLGSGSHLEHLALVGAALGGVLGLVPSEHRLGRFVGFAVGFLLAWAGFAVRAAGLPDSTAGRALACFGVLVLLALLSGLTAGRIPLWASLLGAASLVAAYETTYSEAPARFLVDSPQAASTALVAAAIGVLTTTLAQSFIPGTEAGRTRPHDGPDGGDDADQDADTSRSNPVPHRPAPQPVARVEDQLTLDDALGGRA